MIKHNIKQFVSLIIIYKTTVSILDALFTNIDEVYCRNDRYGVYCSLDEAKSACILDNECGYVNDASCDNSGPFLLGRINSGLRGSISGSCVYKKIGNKLYLLTVMCNLTIIL